MSELAVVDGCTRFDRWLSAYADDELDAMHALEIEEHLAACENCSERISFDRALRTSLRRTKLVASDSLRHRVAAALLAESVVSSLSAATDAVNSAELGTSTCSSAATAKADAQPRVAPKLVRLRYVMPLAVAAGLALVIGALRLRDPATLSGIGTTSLGTSQATMQTVSAFDRFIDELVDAHIQPSVPEVTDDDGLSRLNPFVGVRVPRPELTALGAHYLGARMHRRHAAMLQYATGDRRRMTLYVYNPARVPVQASRLQARVIGQSHVYLGHIRGYAVAASEHDGVGYALASDLSDKETEDAIVMAAR